MERIVCHLNCKHLLRRLLLAIYRFFLSFYNKESVVLSSVISVHASGKHGEIKVVPVVTRLSNLLGPRCSDILDMLFKCIDWIIQYFASQCLISNPRSRNFGESFFPPPAMLIILSRGQHESINNISSARSTTANYSKFNSRHVHCCCHVTTLESYQTMFLNDGLFRWLSFRLQCYEYIPQS